MNYKLIFFFLILIGIFASCKSRYKKQTYSLDRNIQFCDSCEQRKVWASNPKKSIILISDSTLNYNRTVGHMGFITKIKYKLSNDTLILSSTDIYDRRIDEIFQDISFKYRYNKDSLISLNNNEKYYSRDYIESKTKAFEPFYLVIDNKKKKISNRKKAIRILKRLWVRREKELTEIDVDSAFIEYNISKEFKTYKVN